MKKLLLVIVSLFIFSTLFTVTTFAGDGMSEKDLIEEVDDNIDKLIDTTSKVKEVAKSAETLSEVQKNFQSFMKNVGYAGTVLTAINGTVNFLKLIGVIEDSNATNINNIRMQLEAIDARLDEMDKKLNTITTEMAKIDASVEYNSRVEKAMLLEGSWNDFTYRYLEEGLDKLMDQYDAMLINGMRDWFSGTSRNTQSITVVYDSSFNVSYSITNTVDSSLLYVTLKGDIVPASLTWNVDTYKEDLENYLYNAIKNDSTFSNIETNIDSSLFNDDLIRRIANDAVNTLVYRITAAAINKDASYAKELLRVYENYALHLSEMDNGIDAVIKTYYLTHAFEGEVKEDIEDFCNRMALKNGVYGMFVATVIGASNTTTHDEKYNYLSTFNSSMKAISATLENSFTGYDDYSYITNTRIRLCDLDFTATGSSTIKVAGNGEAKYVSGSLSDITMTLDESTPSYLIGDAKVLLLEKVLSSNGISMTYDYFKENDLAPLTYNYGKLVTTAGGNAKFTFDGTELFVNKVSTDYFNTQTITKLPSKTDSDGIAKGVMISGSYYDFESHTLETGKTLAASVLYAEDHWYWRVCEVVYLAGPSDMIGSCGCGITNVDKYQRRYDFSYISHYNVLVCMPIEESFKSTSYSPILSYKDFIDSIPNVVIDPVIDPIPKESVDYFFITFSIMGGLALITLIGAYVVKEVKDRKTKFR